MLRPEARYRPSVLIVDDSSATRAMLAKALKARGFDVLGGAADPYMARDLIFKLAPDVITLDLQMPRMDGLSFLARLMSFHPIPVLVLSSLTLSKHELALQAMELGAVDVFPKPSGSLLTEELDRLALALHRVAAATVRPRPRGVARNVLPGELSDLKDLGSDRLIAIGASTGGTTAITALLSELPGSFPPVLIVQHMPENFTAAFAARLNRLGRMRVREAKDGDHCETGLALLAPGGRHMTLQPGNRVRVAEGPPVHHVAPSVDVLFDSVAKVAGARAIGLLLTGMGKDGAHGLKAMRQAGATTLAQDRDSSVVWGMPGEAVTLNAADAVLPLNAMPGYLAGLLRREAPASSKEAV